MVTAIDVVPDITAAMQSLVAALRMLVIVL